MSYAAPGFADGIRFYAVADTGYPGREAVDKIASGLDRARFLLARAMTRTYALAAGSAVERNNDALAYCFRPAEQEIRQTCEHVRGVLAQTLAGLRTPDLSIRAADEAECKAQRGDGYVPGAKLGVLALMGDIHVRFSLPSDDMPRLLIHEGTHKFAATQDFVYSMSSDLQRLLELKHLGMNVDMRSRLESHADGLLNAESYAAFAVCVV